MMPSLFLISNKLIKVLLLNKNYIIIYLSQLKIHKSLKQTSHPFCILYDFSKCIYCFHIFSYLSLFKLNFLALRWETSLNICSLLSIRTITQFL